MEKVICEYFKNYKSSCFKCKKLYTVGKDGYVLFERIEHDRFERFSQGAGKKHCLDLFADIRPLCDKCFIYYFDKTKERYCWGEKFYILYHTDPGGDKLAERIYPERYNIKKRKLLSPFEMHDIELHDFYHGAETIKGFANSKPVNFTIGCNSCDKIFEIIYGEPILDIFSLYGKLRKEDDFAYGTICICNTCYEKFSVDFNEIDDVIYKQTKDKSVYEWDIECLKELHLKIKKIVYSKLYSKHQKENLWSEVIRLFGA